MLCAELLSGGWSVFGGWSQIFVPQAKLPDIIVKVQKLKLTATQNGSKNCRKKIMMFTKEILMFKL
jgi:hypothetical protein